MCLKYFIIKTLCSSLTSHLFPGTMPLLCIHSQPNISKELTVICLHPPLTTCPGRLASGSTLSLIQFLTGRLVRMAQSSKISLSSSYLVVPQHPSSLEPLPWDSGFIRLVSSTFLAAPPVSLLFLHTYQPLDDGVYRAQGLGLSPHLFFPYALSLGHPS